MDKDHKSEQKINKDFPDFSLKKYLKDDKWALMLDLIGSLAIVYAADEWLGAFGNYFMNKVKLLFIFVGMGGSFVITHLFGAAKDRFRTTVKQFRDTETKNQ